MGEPPSADGSIRCAHGARKGGLRLSVTILSQPCCNTVPKSFSLSDFPFYTSHSGVKDFTVSPNFQPPPRGDVRKSASEMGG